MQRDEFLQDVRGMVDATKKEYILRLEEELHRAANVWIDDVIQILPKAEGTTKLPRLH